MLDPLAENTPLAISIRDHRLVIEIGVDTLAFADIERRNNELPEGSPHYEIINAERFAKDVVYELTREDGIGATLVTDLLDRAMDKAIENGSANVKELS